MRAFILSLAVPIAALATLTAQAPPQQELPRLLEVSSGEMLLVWQGHTGRSYFMQVSDPSDHLRKWVWAPVIEGGNDEEISYEVDASSDRSFFRIHYTDKVPGDGETLDTADFDGDGISNIDEIDPPFGAQTNPLNPDTDGDGLPDGWERAHGIDPNDNGSIDPQNGADGLFQGGPSTNAEAYAQGVAADPSATVADHDGDGIPNEIDADPYEKLIDWTRSPAVSSYAVIDLNMGPLQSFSLPHGRYPVEAVLNDNGELCREPDTVLSELTPAVWDGTSFPVSWTSLQNHNDSNGNPQDFSLDWNSGFSNSGVIYHGHSIEDDGINSAQGIQTLTFVWNNSGSAPSVYGNMPQEAGVSRLVEARFDQFAVDERISPQAPAGNPAPATGEITSGSFTLDTSGTTPPDLWPFNFYSHAPDVTRTGKILIGDNGQFKVNNVPAPSNFVYGLAADPHGNDLIVTTPSLSSFEISTHRHRNGAWEKMPMPGIMDMNAAGTGITFPDHQVWSNGSTILLDNLLDESAWSEFKAEQINARGVILGSALPQGESQHKAVLMVPATLVAKQAGASETEEGVHFMTLSDPKPEVEISVDDSFVNAQGALEIHVSGSVRDHLSEVLATDRISQLLFKVNGNVVHTIQLSYGQGDAPWTLVDSTNEFSEILTIPYPKPGGYEVRAETDENGAGNVGWGKVAVGLIREDDPTAETEAFSDLTVALSAVTTDTAVDQMTVYFGDRAPEAGDAVFTETAVDSGIFTGSLLIGGVSRSCEIDMQPADGLVPAERDHLAAEISYELAGGAHASSFISFEESAAASLRFRPDGYRVTGERNSVKRLADLPASQGGGFESLLLKVAVPDAWAAAHSIKVLVNSQEHSLKKFTYGGKEEWYVVGNAGDERPKIFIPCHKALPSENAFPGTLVPGEAVKWELVINSVQHSMGDTLVMAGIPDPDPPGAAAIALTAPESSEASGATATGSWEEPGDTVNCTDLVTAYKFIYPDEISQALLRVYLSEGHEISLEDVLGDFKFSYRWRYGNKALIKIENDDNDIHPGICAQYLWRGLNNALTIYSFRNALAEELNEAGLEIDAMIAYKAQVGPAAAETGIAAAELYLSGIGIINEPLDWILIVNDVSEGHYSSLAAALPLIPRGLLTATKGIRIQTRTGQSLGSLNRDSFAALQDAARIQDMNALGTVMDEYQLSKYIGKIISADGGWVRVPKDRDGLKNAMRRRVPKPNDDFIAHHDLIWEQAEWFARHGINVNNPAFGRWVHKTEHDAWHKGAAGGDYNAFWNAFIVAERGRERYTVAEIIDKLNECRQMFPVTITE